MRMQENTFLEKEKICSVCKLSKSVNVFYKSNRSKNGYRSECKECHGKNVREYYKNNLESRRKYARKYYSEHRDEIRSKAKKAYYKMKEEDEQAKQI
jgi:hypothetical protein